MRLVSYIRNGVTRAGVLRENDEVVDVNRALGARLCDEGVPRPELAADALNPASMIDLLAVGAPALEAIRATLTWLDGGALSPTDLVANGSVVPPHRVPTATRSNRENACARRSKQR